MRRTESLAVIAAWLLLFAAGGAAPAQDSGASSLLRAKAWLEARADRPRRSAGAGMDDPKAMAAAAVRLWVAEIDADDGGADPRRAALERSVAAASGGESVAMGAYANWMAGFAALPLVEKSLREGRADPALRRLAAGFEERQNAEGGWGHGGAGEMTSFYPTTLVITTDLALFSLGMARRLYVPVDEAVVDRGLQLLSDVQGAGGAFPYGGRAYRKGFEAGRTASAVVALAALGQGNDERFRRAAAYLLANVAATPDGHASPAIHVLFGGLAAAILGAEAQRAWDETVLARVARAQAEDGSFRDVVQGSPDSLPLLGDATTNAEYVTSLYAAALAARRSRIASALRVPRVAPAARGQAAPAPPPESWTAADIPIVALDCDATRVAALGPTGRIVARDAATGRRVWTGSIPGVFLAETGSAVVIDRDTVFAFALFAEEPDAIVVGGVVHGAASRPATTGRLAAFAATDGALRWSSDVLGMPAVWVAAPGGLWLRRRTGSLVRFDRGTGVVLEERAGPAVPLNTTAAWLGDGRIASTDEATLLLRDAAGDEIWRRTLRGARGVHAPAWTAVVADGDSLLCGATDGTVGAWTQEGGKRLWSRELGAGVLSVARAPDASDVVLALTDDGRVFGLRDGAVAWTQAVGSDRESTHESRLRVRGGAAWIGSTSRDGLVRLDSRDGHVAAFLPLPRAAAWTTFGGFACVASGATLRCWRLP